MRRDIRSADRRRPGGDAEGSPAALLGEIDKAINAKLCYLAIAVALAVPHGCAGLECEPDKPKRSTSHGARPIIAGIG